MRTTDNAVDCLVEGSRGDLLLVLASGQQGCLVQNVGKVGTGETRSATGNHAEVNVWADWLALRVHVQNLLATLEVWCGDADLAVETTRAQQRRVKNVWAVGGGNQDHVGLGVEAIHLDQKLVEGLLALVVSAADACAAVATNGVDLVDKDDGRGSCLGLLEEVANAGCTDTDEHLYEVRTRDREERHTGLASDSLGNQGLTGSRRAVKQNTARNFGANGLELLWLLEEFFDFL